MKAATPVAFFAAALALVSLGAAPEGCEEGGFSQDLDGDGPGSPQGIVNGVETEYEYFKGVVGLYYSMGATGGSICTGTLIDPQVILSAGHCVYSPGDGIDAVSNHQNLMVLGGANLNNSGGVIMYPVVTDVEIHPDWGGQITTTSVDLSMIKLSSPIDSVETYRIRTDDSFDVGDTGKIVGYGLSSSSSPNSAGIHREGDTTIQNKLMHYINLGNPSGTCQGDSGGPFFTMVGEYWHLTGVTSLGLSGTCDPDNGSVDVNVTQKLDWIEDTLNSFVGYGLEDIPHQDPPETDSDADGDGDSDGDSDGDADGDEDAGPDGGTTIGDEGCGCRLARPDEGPGLLQATWLLF